MTTETKSLPQVGTWGQVGTGVGLWATVVLLTSICPRHLSAQMPAEDRGAAGMLFALRQATNPTRILYIVAHPDDEDAGTLTWLARGRGAHVTLLSLTRGESGANLITGDFFDQLGALRTLEHQRATSFYGVNLAYTRFADFGYSKNVAETWRNWNREEILGEVVRKVRDLRPHIIMARFSGTPRDGHGHHQASGLLAQEAFTAAADPQRFSRDGPPWQTLKLYLGGWQPGEAGRLAIDAGEYDAVSGRSYAQIGREGYRWHRSQAMGAVLARPGPSVTTYRLAASKVPTREAETSPFEGLDLGAGVPDEARQALAAFDARKPESGAPMIAEALRKSEGDVAGALNRALALALGLEFEALVESPQAPTGIAAQFRPATTFRTAVQDQVFRVQTTLYNQSGTEIREVRRRIAGSGNWPILELGEGRFDVSVPSSASTAVPWFRSSVRTPKYEGETSTATPIIAELEYEYRGAIGRLRSVPRVSSVDSIGLQHREPISAGPAIGIRFASRNGILPLARNEYAAEVIVRNVGDQASKGVVKLEVPAGWTSRPATAEFAFQRAGEESRIPFQVLPSGGAAGEFTVRAVAMTGEKEYRASFDRITYAGLESLYLSYPAEHTLRRLDVGVRPNLRVGYVMGTGDGIPAALRQLGANVELLDSGALASADLSVYDTILLGIRAYAAREDLRTHNSRLLDYVAAGGTLIVQYNTQEFDHNFGPYPYQMTIRAEETSEEDAPVEILTPQHPVFRLPNRISKTDFDGWFEQRGSKFFTNWDARYTPLIETHDTGQAPQKGVWLAAKYGKGVYVYCALAWYRQLPMAVPGAIRLFANLVSLQGDNSAQEEAGGRK